MYAHSQQEAKRAGEREIEMRDVLRARAHDAFFGVILLPAQTQTRTRTQTPTRTRTRTQIRIMDANNDYEYEGQIRTRIQI